VTTTTQVEYVSAIKVNNYTSGSETVHAADPAKVDDGNGIGTKGRYLVTTRCGIKHADVQRTSKGEWPLFAQAMRCTRCSRCEVLIRKERGLGDVAEPLSLLRHFLATLPTDHPDVRGVARAIEILEVYS
jgi:hypothetical protein